MRKTIHCPIKRIFLIVVLLFTEIVVSIAGTNYYFYVQFTDKNKSPFSLSNPSAYLSEKAIARRTAFGLNCDSTDLPINPTYLQQISNLGISVHSSSKWMNGTTILLSDSSKMSQVRTLPFVKFVEYTGKHSTVAQVVSKRAKTSTNLNYGAATTQINQLSGKYLHNYGFRGKGILIAVIDAGFMNANTTACFDSLRLQGRLLGTKDIFNPSSNIFAEDGHGAMVLSTMTGNLPNQFLGTAPDASYFLIRTEYAPTEYKMETDFWCSGIEYADSIGSDLINSSLGYYTFDDPSMNFSYADMNGKVSRASRAANMASKKGIIVVVSAGNEGLSAWHQIGSPADAEDIVTVGAVRADSVSSTFSSYGPSADNRIKPELCAMGSAAAIVTPSGDMSFGDGTSFASPILAGMMACYLQAVKKSTGILNLKSILKSVFESANFYQTPTTQKGYGLPNFEIASRNLSYFSNLRHISTNDEYELSFDSKNKSILIWALSRQLATGTSVRIYSTTGKLVIQKKMSENLTKIDAQNLTSGIYALCIIEAGRTETKKIIIP